MVEGSVDCETWLGIISPHGVAWTVWKKFKPFRLSRSRLAITEVTV